MVAGYRKLICLTTTDTVEGSCKLDNYPPIPKIVKVLGKAQVISFD